MEEKDSLYTNSLEDTTYSNCLVDAAIAHGNDNTLVGLYAFLAAFYDSYTNSDCVPNIDFGDIILYMIRFY